jgi:hypothetical protein
VHGVIKVLPLINRCNTINDFIGNARVTGIGKDHNSVAALKAAKVLAAETLVACAMLEIVSVVVILYKYTQARDAVVIGC